jgi:hypothetical protein
MASLRGPDPVAARAGRRASRPDGRGATADDLATARPGHAMDRHDTAAGLHAGPVGHRDTEAGLLGSADRHGRVSALRGSAGRRDPAWDRRRMTGVALAVGPVAGTVEAGARPGVAGGLDRERVGRTGRRTGGCDDPAGHRAPSVDAMGRVCPVDGLTGATDRDRARRPGRQAWADREPQRDRQAWQSDRPCLSVSRRAWPTGCRSWGPCHPCHPCRPRGPTRRLQGGQPRPTSTFRRQRCPSRVSSTVTPCAASSSRSRSDAAKSRAVRAAARSSSRAATSGSRA